MTSSKIEFAIEGSVLATIENFEDGIDVSRQDAFDLALNIIAFLEPSREKGAGLATALALKKEGVTNYRIGEIVGVDESTVRRWIRKHNNTTREE
jgi:hypothetical protein